MIIVAFKDLETVFSSAEFLGLSVVGNCVAVVGVPNTFVFTACTDLFQVLAFL